MWGEGCGVGWCKCSIYPALILHSHCAHTAVTGLSQSTYSAVTMVSQCCYGAHTMLTSTPFLIFFSPLLPSLLFLPYYNTSSHFLRSPHVFTSPFFFFLLFSSIPFGQSMCVSGRPFPTPLPILVTKTERHVRTAE